ncbi:MAG TPA: succinate dehydrogenase/fumarate reductase iron-sulfur subunit [Candidatus Limnocylindrales bacterium]|nr:succinate dehydrogenase/fumarate reductase iron-sulfur subunit [Candidatus Limnocylindrales bacterium]
METTNSRQATMTVKVRVWRQANAEAAGRFVEYVVRNVVPDMSFLEMLDVLNEQLVSEGQDVIAFDSDCREGICGSCGCMVNGIAHGPGTGKTVCQLFMRVFRDGEQITVEPFRAKAFPVVKDLVVNRSALDRIVSAGGYVSVNTGAPRDANEILIGKETADKAFDAAACIGCGACVAACKNASAVLFTGAKVAHLAYLPQGHPERYRRAVRMVEQMESEGFGACSNEGECEAVCPKRISTRHIQILQREYLKGMLRGA